MKLQDISPKLLKEQHDEDDVFTAALLLFHVFRFSHGGKVEYYHEKLQKPNVPHAVIKSLVEISDDSGLLAKYDVKNEKQREDLQDIISVYTWLRLYKIPCDIDQAEEAVLWARDPSTNPLIHQQDRDNEDAISNLIFWLDKSGQIAYIQQDLEDRVHASHGAYDMEWVDHLEDYWEPPKGMPKEWGLKYYCMSGIKRIYKEFTDSLDL